MEDISNIPPVPIRVFLHEVEAGVILAHPDPTRCGFAYHPDYHGPVLDPIALDYAARAGIGPRARRFPTPPGKTLHEVFRDTLPGPFAHAAILATDPDYARAPEALRLARLGSRPVGALRYVVDPLPNEPERPIQGARALETVRKAAVAFHLRASRTLLEPTTRWALTSNGGARPKAEYADESGQRWIAKFALPTDPYDIARIEHATLALARDAGLRAPQSRIETTPNGESLLLVARFDRTPAGQPLHKLSLAALTGRDNSERRKPVDADLADVVRIVRAVSAAPETDVRELATLGLLWARANITDNHLRNLEMLLTPAGWRLAPVFDLQPDPGRAPFATRIAGAATQAQTRGEHFATQLARICALDRKAIAALDARVREALRAWPRHLRAARATPADQALALSAIDLEDPGVNVRPPARGDRGPGV